MSCVVIVVAVLFLTNFKQLLFPQNIKLAEEWAKRNGLLFPPIDADDQFDREGWKECYVFKDPTNPKCPIVLHFVLVNKTYRDFIRPGKNAYPPYFIVGGVMNERRWNLVANRQQRRRGGPTVIALTSHIESSEFEPWPGTLWCVLGQDTLLSQCLSPPRCINGYRRI